MWAVVLEYVVLLMYLTALLDGGSSDLFFFLESNISEQHIHEDEMYNVA